MVRLTDKVPEPNPAWSGEDPDSATSYAPYRLYNIGNNNPVELTKFISVLENCLGKKAKKNLLPMQPGDVPETFADVNDLAEDVGFMPATPIEEGIKNLWSGIGSITENSVRPHAYGFPRRSRVSFAASARNAAPTPNAFSSKSKVEL